MDFSELLHDFVGESLEHVAVLETGLMDIESGRQTPDTINQLFRAVHTIKGSAGIFPLTNMVRLAHAMEDYFGALRDQTVGASAEMIDVMLQATDLLKEMTNDIEGSKSAVVEPLVERIRGLATAVPSPGPAPTSDGFDEMEALWSELTGALPENEPKSTVAIAETEINEEHTERVEATVAKTTEKSVGADDTVRVNVGLLNELLNVTGEMILSRNQLLRLLEDSGDEQGPLHVVAQQINYTTADLQEKVMKTRMYPISLLFGKFPRIVRELSRTLKKDVELVIRGAEVELDRTLIEALTDPMTHLVRNSMDHGIEAQNVRRAKQKPATGHITLHAYNRNDRVVVEISDDGKGVDFERVRQRIQQNKLLSDSELAFLADEELVKFLFHPGFSTAQTVTDVSGRGVGMDVVKTNIEALGGTIELFSRPGDGTTVKLILPLTLAIVPTLVVAMQDLFFAIPQAVVQEIVLLQSEDDWPISFPAGFPLLHLRGQWLPVVRFNDVMGDGGDAQRYFATKDKSLRILILQSGSLYFGLEVDSIHSQGDRLVKPLPVGMQDTKLYSGVTVLGDGQIAMIITPEGIAQQMRIPAGTQGQVFSSAQDPIGDSADGQHLLLFRSFADEVLGIDLGTVRRVEKLSDEKVAAAEETGFVEMEGHKVRSIKPGQLLQLDCRRTTSDKGILILLDGLKVPVGLLASEIVSVGATAVDEPTAMLLDLYTLLELAVPEYYTPTQSLASTVAKARVLLLEDNVVFAKLIIGYLHSAGYEVTHAENGRIGYDYILEHPVDVVVSDIEMPVMDGLEFAEKIRAYGPLRDVPLLALTSLEGDVHRDRGLRAGFDVYASKTDIARLAETVENLLKTAQARSYANGPRIDC